MKKVNNIQDNNTLNFKSIETEKNTIEDLAIDGLRESITQKSSPKKLKDSRILNYVSEDMPIKENKKEKKFLNNLHFYEGEDAVVGEEVCVPFLDFVDCLNNLGWVYTNYQDVYKGNKAYTRYTLAPSAQNSKHKKTASAEEVKDALTEIYQGKVDFGKATYRYAPELNYLTVIIPNNCTEEFEEGKEKRINTIKENKMYKKGRYLHEKELKKFCEDNLPAGEEVFYIVKDEDGRYLVNEGEKENPSYFFDRVREEDAEAFMTKEEANEAIVFYCFDYDMDWVDSVDDEDRGFNTETNSEEPIWDNFISEIQEFKDSCSIVPITARKVKEAIKKVARHRIREEKVADKRREVAFYIVQDEDGKYLSETEDGGYTLVDTIDEAEAYDSEEDADSAIFHFNWKLEKDSKSEVELKIIDVYINDLYYKVN